MSDPVPSEVMENPNDTVKIVTIDDDNKEQDKGNPDSAIVKKDAQEKKIDDASQTKASESESSLFKAPMAIPLVRAVIKKTTGAAAEAFDEKSKLPIISLSNKRAADEASDKPEAKTVKYSTPDEKSQEVPIPYKEPAWGGLCTENYSFEVIKNGTVIDTFDLRTKSFHVFGRLPSCDVQMEHPSLSRYHAIVQYCHAGDSRHPVGWYLYDLDSTHGTWVNKTRIKPRVYIRLRVGYVIKLGGSSRLNILQGPADDQDEEAALSISELKEQREKQKAEAEILQQAELADAEAQKLLEKKAAEDTGCSWGIGGDDAEEIMAENPFALTTEPENQDLYLDDPKKALRGYFERQGLELPEYDLVEEGQGKYKCRVELPIDGANSEPIYAETILSGKKREVVAACALEACKILDRHGELRKANHESRARKKKDWAENDFYDSDEDTFLDRTGDIERKRKLRMKRIGKAKQKSQTYESLIEKLEVINKQITDIETQIEESKQKAANIEGDGMDVFDAYMMSLKSGALDTKSKMKLKRQLFDLKQEKMRLEKLAHIAKPALPGVVKPPPSTKSNVLFGKMKGPVKAAIKITKPQAKPVAITTMEYGEEEEEEEDEKEEEKKQNKFNEKPSKTKITPELISELSCEIAGEKAKSTADSNSNKLSERTLQPSKTDNSSHVSGQTVPSVIMNTNMKDSNVNNNTNVAMVISEIISDKTDNEKSRLEAEQLKDSPVEIEKTSQSGSTQQMAAPSIIPQKKRIRLQKKDKHNKEGDKTYTDMTEDPDYAVWMPPTGQSGDGKTALNDKYGY